MPTEGEAERDEAREQLAQARYEGWQLGVESVQASRRTGDSALEEARALIETAEQDGYVSPGWREDARSWAACWFGTAGPLDEPMPAEGEAVKPGVNLPDTFTKTQCVEKKCPRTIPYSAFCKSQSHAKVERVYRAADEVPQTRCSGCTERVQDEQPLRFRSGVLWHEACLQPAGDRRMVDLDRVLFFLRYVDWQEDTAAEAIEREFGGSAPSEETRGDWRCECGDLNRDYETFCYRCGAGSPEGR